jgi:hypothetical protein
MPAAASMPHPDSTPKYGGAVGFMACCLIAVVLSIHIRKKHIPIGVIISAVMFLLVYFYAIGWSLFLRAVTESLTAINQTPGGAAFLVVTVLILVLSEINRGLKDRWELDKVFLIVGKSACIAVGLWLLIFFYKVFMGVPSEVFTKAAQCVIPRPPFLYPPYGWETKSPPGPIRVRADTAMYFINYSLQGPDLFPLKARIICQNGENIARKSFCHGAMLVFHLAHPLQESLRTRSYSLELEREENRAWRAFHGDWLKHISKNEWDRPTRFQQSIDINEPIYLAAPPSRENITNGTDVVYLFASAKWMDDGGVWESDLCSLYIYGANTPTDKSQEWQHCLSGQDHNQTKYEFTGR